MEQELGIETYAVNWPIGCGKEFQGVYDRREAAASSSSPATGHGKKAAATRGGPGRPARRRSSSARTRWQQLRDEVELLGAGREFDMEAVRRGKLSPVFFGSALTNFGVEPFPGGVPAA